MKEMDVKTNRLDKASSPYLKQHARNPVDWYAWGEEALSKARSENKPILLSIGYAACHWCHVMAHESFEDHETAELMNKLFINIKVDREERPDLDKIYQTAHYLLTRQSGGWPLTVFLTPNDLAPFFSGTYFPLEARYHLPAFKDVLRTLAELYQHNQQDIKIQNQELLTILQQQARQSGPVQLSDQPIQLALQELAKRYDPLRGGFGGAPKFPQPTKLEFLLKKNLPEVVNTLQHMAQGGIFDQLGGGFFRYTVDADWQIPHFEKMLYDNAQLLYLYALLAAHVLFAETARETAQWVLTTMQAPEAGFFSSIDADSEGKEGKFYVWSKEEIERLLTKQEYEIVAPYYGLDQSPNFEQHWQLHIIQPLASIAKQLQIPVAAAQKLLMTARQKLLAARQERIPPALDKKILTAWNGLMIKGLFIAGIKLREPRFISAAQQALNFIQEKLWQNKRLLASYAEGKAYLPAYLDDYAFLIDALLISLQTTWKSSDLHFSIELADSLLNYFYDTEAGGFFFTANDQEKIIFRPKSMTDEAIPSGNGVAARVLLVLGHLLGEPRYLQAAEKTLQAAWAYLQNFPAEHGTLLLALEEFLQPSRIIILRGTINDMQTWHAWCYPQDYVFAIPNDAKELPSALELRRQRDKTCAYICKGTQCSAAIENIEEFKRILEEDKITLSPKVEGDNENN